MQALASILILVALKERSRRRAQPCQSEGRGQGIAPRPSLGTWIGAALDGRQLQRSGEPAAGPRYVSSQQLHLGRERAADHINQGSVTYETCNAAGYPIYSNAKIEGEFETPKPVNVSTQRWQIACAESEHHDKKQRHYAADSGRGCSSW